jgi:hypothetical protein
MRQTTDENAMQKQTPKSNARLKVVGANAPAGGFGLDRAGDRALLAVRPAVEAALLAAVAFGCAQVGWAALTPGVAEATSARADGGSATPAPAPAMPVLSPFAVGAGGDDSAATALMANLKLTGVRVGADPARSSAMIVMADGAQRAFLVGSEIGDGVSLAQVSNDYIVLSYAGGQRQLALPGAPAGFAKALMGTGPIPASAPRPGDIGLQRQPAARAGLALTPADITPFNPAPPPAALDMETVAPVVLDGAPMGLTPIGAGEALSGAALAAPPVSAVRASADGRAWFARLAADGLGAAEAGGWRLPASLPAEALSLGLAPGDLIISVNGADASQTAAALAALAASGPVSMEVERAGVRMRLTTPGQASVQTGGAP